MTIAAHIPTNEQLVGRAHNDRYMYSLAHAERQGLRAALVARIGAAARQIAYRADQGDTFNLAELAEQIGQMTVAANMVDNWITNGHRPQ